MKLPCREKVSAVLMPGEGGFTPDLAKWDGLLVCRRARGHEGEHEAAESFSDGSFLAFSWFHTTESSEDANDG